MSRGTFALVPQVVDAVKVPVIAAGGIAANHVAEATIWTQGPVLRAREAYTP